MDKRYHALDALRASMMLLGLVFHTVISYAVSKRAAWSYHDAATTLVADIIVDFTHIFRMPIFFVLAGFFAAMLYMKRSPGGLASNRAMRIVVPFVIGWAALHPLVISGAVFANVAQARSIDFGLLVVSARFRNGSLFFPDNTLHLWFLYYLIYFYALAFLLSALAPRLPATWHTKFLKFFESIVSRPLSRLLILTFATAGVLLPLDGVFPTSTSFVPDTGTLVSYGVFLSFGWALFL
jgi:glucan biosynthesis protein C